jgi:8-oxo-dGTP pyrophosphatase MutT (NUDIX family)
MFLDTQGKLERIDAINAQLLQLESTKDLLLSQYQDVQKALSSDEFACKDELKFDEHEYLKSVAKIKRLEKSLGSELEALNSDKVVDRVIYENRRKKATSIIKSLYRSGKLNLDQYNDAVYKDKNGAVLYADVIVTDNQSRFLLLKRSIWEDNHKGAWVIPGGHVDMGETFEEAAIRELREESGISIENLKNTGFQYSWRAVGTYKDDKAHIEYFNLHLNDAKEIEILLDEAESRDYQWTPIAEIDNYPMVFNMRDNIIKIMGWEAYPQVKLIRKAIAQGVIPIEKVGDIIKALCTAQNIEKSRSHKYISKKPDGKGGWVYEYQDSSSVSKKFNFDIEKIEEYGKRICIGREQLIKRLSPEEELGRIKGGRRNVEAALVIGGDAITDSTEPERIDELLTKQEEKLQQYAKAVGIWVDHKDIQNNWSKLGRGEEAIVYRDDEEYVKKVFDYKLFSMSPLEFLDNRISLHNHLFPDTHYELIGFTKDPARGLCFIVKQAFIDNTVNTPITDIAVEMAEMGFELVDGIKTYANDNYVVEDLHSANVKRDKDGRLFFIDTVVSLNEAGEEYDGKRKYNDIDIDIEKSIDELYLTDQMSDDEFGVADAIRDIEKAKKDLSKLKKIKKFVKKDGKIFLQTYYVKTGEREEIELPEKYFKDVIPDIEDIEAGKEYEVTAGNKTTKGLLVDIAYLEKKDSYYMLLSTDEGKITWRQFDTIKSIKLLGEEEEKVQKGYELVKELGGSTGAKLMKSPSNQLVVVKQGASIDHIASEYDANRLYSRLGCNVPDAMFKNGALYMDYIEDGKPLSQFLGTSGEKHVLDLARKGFVADCLMGNWDVAGMDYDNMLYSEKYDRVYRVDVGGSLQYRAQGGLKDNWGEQVFELDTLRDPATNPTAARIFKDISNADIIEQIQKAYMNVSGAVDGKYESIIKDRLNWLYEEMKRRIGESELSDQDDMYEVDKVLTPKDIVDFYADVNELMKVNKVDYQVTLDNWVKDQNSNAGNLTNENKAHKFLKNDFSEEVLDGFLALGLNYCEIAAINLYTRSYYSYINDALSEMTNGKLGNVHFKEGSLSHQMIEDASKKEGNTTYIGEKTYFDSFFSVALAAAMTINGHHDKKDQNYNQAKIDAFLGNWNALQGKLLESDLSDASRAALTQLEAIYSKIEKVRNSSAFDKVPFIEYPEIGNKLQDYDTPGVVEAKTGKALKNSEDSGMWKYAAKIMTRGLTKIERAKNPKYLASGQTLRNVKLHGVHDQELFDSQHKYDDYVVHARASSSKKDATNTWDMTHQMMIMGPPSAYIRDISQHKGENEVLHRPFSLFKCGNTFKLNGYNHILMQKLV